MSVVECLEKEASSVANLLNIAVVLGALEGHERCVQCNYPENSKRFDILLESYTKGKIQLHRIQRLERHGIITWKTFRSEFGRQDKECSLTRELLTPIFPCEDCVKKYNPTRKHRPHAGIKPVRHQKPKPRLESLMK